MDKSLMHSEQVVSVAKYLRQPVDFSAYPCYERFMNTQVAL